MISRVYGILDKTPELPFFIAAVFYITFVPRGDFPHIFSTAFLFLTACIIVGSALKLTFKTKRPQELTSFPLFKYGFPSLHAMVSVGAIAYVYFINQSLALILAPIGLLFMISRTELHYHTRKDVWGGALLGIIIGALAGTIGLSTHLPQKTEVAFTLLFFITPVVFSIFRLKHKI